MADRIDVNKGAAFIPSGEHAALRKAMDNDHFKEVTDGQEMWVEDPHGNKLWSVIIHEHRSVELAQIRLWSDVLYRMQNGSSAVFMRARLEIVARIILRNHENESDVKFYETHKIPKWKFAIILAGEILSLDLGPVIGVVE